MKRPSRMMAGLSISGARVSVLTISPGLRKKLSTKTARKPRSISLAKILQKRRNPRENGRAKELIISMRNSKILTGKRYQGRGGPKKWRK